MFKITSVKIQKLESENSKLVGIVKVIIDDCFAIGDIRIIQGNKDKGLFIAFPSRKQKSGEFKDICHPLNAETRKKFEDLILAEFITGNKNESINN